MRVALHEPWYSESLSSFVVQLIVAPDAVTPVDATPEITGGVVSAAASVVNVESPESARLLAASLDRTRSAHNVFAASPLSATEWAVTSVVFSALALPYAVVSP